MRIELSTALVALHLAAACLSGLRVAQAQSETEAFQPSNDKGVTLGDSGVRVLGATRPPMDRLPDRPPDDDLPPIYEDSIEPTSEPPEEPPPTFRTMCVRLCDGYFYPMSYAVAPDLFERDRTRCEASCPGTPMDLFYGETAVEDNGKLQSRTTGKLYADLPAAFLHQKVRAKVPANCICTVPRKGVNIIAGEPPRGDDDPNILGEISGPISKALKRSNEAVVVPIVPSDSVVEMPLPGAVVEESLPADIPIDLPPGPRKIRVVSPAPLPDRSAAGDRQGPDRQQAR